MNMAKVMKMLDLIYNPMLKFSKLKSSHSSGFREDLKIIFNNSSSRLRMISELIMTFNIRMLSSDLSQ